MIRWLALLLILPFAAWAQDYPPQLHRHVNDFADVIVPTKEIELAEALATLERETGVQAVVVTVRRRSDHGPALGVEDWTAGLFDAWGIGDGGRDDGILILVGVDDREMRLELGAAYGGAWDAQAQRVVDSAILPAFREGDYAGGLLAGVRALRPRLVDPFLAGAPPPSDSVFGPLALGLAVVGGITAFRHRRALGDLLVLVRRCPACGARRLERAETVTQAPTTRARGAARQVTTCAACGDRRERDVVLPRVRRRSKVWRSSGGGSRGGGGGGRSGGGGASGRW